MSTKELIQSALETMDESQLSELYPIVKGFAEAKQAAPQSLMSKLRSIKLIDAPEDFATNLDLYMSAEKRVP